VTETSVDLRSLYGGRRGRVQFVDVPPLNYLLVAGEGDPSGSAFTDAVRALYIVSYRAHLKVKRERGDAAKVMPVEALWWAEDPIHRDLLAAVALGFADFADSAHSGRSADSASSHRGTWRWQAMIVQPEPVDEDVVAQAITEAGAKGLPALDRLRFERWHEGRAAQLLHVGPYAGEGRAIIALHDAIEAAGCRPRGRHHEIYLSDPRRTAPENVRTLLRHPVEPG
jgi:hypothetical protein